MEEGSPIVKYSAPRVEAAVKYYVKIVIDDMKDAGEIFNPKTILRRVKDKLISPSKKKKLQSLKDFNQQEMTSLERFKENWGNTIKESKYYNEWLNESLAAEERKSEEIKKVSETKTTPSILKKKSIFKKKYSNVRDGPRIHFDPNNLKGGRRKRTRRKRTKKRTKRKRTRRRKRTKRRRNGGKKTRRRKKQIGCRKIDINLITY